MKHSMRTKRVWVQVAKEDIENGLKLDCYYCPVSIAVNRLLGDKYVVSMSGSRGVIYTKDKFNLDKGIVQEIQVPREAEDFIYRFDGFAEGDVQPIGFWMELPKACLIEGVQG